MTGRSSQRRRVLAAGALAITLLSVPMMVHTPAKLVWNASASAPLGLYRISDTSALSAGMLVAYAPPPPLDVWLDRRGYLPRRAPLLKRVAALPGALVCRQGAEVSINGRVVATALTRDRKGRLLPSWQGCKTVGPQQVLLLTADQPHSLDGRYFGVSERRHVLGQADQLWRVDGAP
jgi:conjugative transfer signal peptidase TraF